jgi:hypothetical protein
MAAITCTTSEDDVLKTKQNSQASPGFIVPELNAKQSSYLILYKSAPTVKSFLNLMLAPGIMTLFELPVSKAGAGLKCISSLRKHKGVNIEQLL